LQPHGPSGISQVKDNLKPPPGPTTARGVAQPPPYATTQPLPPPVPPAKPPRKTAIAVPIVRPPAMAASSPQAKTMIGEPPLQTSEDLDFPDSGTEKGFLDLDDQIAPASTAKGFAPPANTTAPTMVAQRGPAALMTAPPTSEDLDFPDSGTEKGFLDLDDATSPAAKQNFAPPPPPPPPPSYPSSSPAARTLMVQPPPGPLEPPMWPPQSAQPAASPLSRPMAQSPVVMDVTPRGLGIGTVAGYCEELIRRNSHVPTETRKLFTTSRDDQDAVRIIVCQGESRRLDNNVVIGDLLLQGLPRRPRGETSIEVTFHLDANGILQVHARDAQTGNEQRASLDLVGAMPKEEVSASRERLQALRR
jgi:hypothetical protein